jgi:hypothetical protein
MAIVLFGGRRWLTVLVLGCLGGFIAEYLQATLGLARVAELIDGIATDESTRSRDPRIGPALEEHVVLAVLVGHGGKCRLGVNHH